MTTKQQLRKELRSLGVKIENDHISKKDAFRLIAMTKHLLAEASDSEMPESVKKEIEKYLADLVKDNIRLLEANPEEYTEHGTDTPSIDVRLQWHDGRWSIHEGSSDYDVDHRGYWGASSITPDTDAKKLAKDLIDQVEMEMAER